MSTEEPDKVQLNIFADTAAFAEAMETAVQATAEAIAAINEQTVVSLQAKLRSLYAQAVENSDAPMQVVLIQLMFMADNGGRDAQVDIAEFEEYVNAMSDAPATDRPVSRSIEVVETELRTALASPALDVLSVMDRQRVVSVLVRELMELKDAAEQCYVIGCRNATGPDDLYCENHVR